MGSADLVGENKDDPMSLAFAEARSAELRGEAPIGAALVREGIVIASAGNRTRELSDPTAHAEMIVIREAAAKIGSERLVGCDLYVTLEPCAMCAGAISLPACAGSITLLRTPRAALSTTARASSASRPATMRRRSTGAYAKARRRRCCERFSPRGGEQLSVTVSSLRSGAGRRRVSKDDPERAVAASWSILRDTKLRFAPQDEGWRRQAFAGCQHRDRRESIEQSQGRVL